MTGEQIDFGFRTPPRRRRPKRGRPKKPNSGVPHRPREVNARFPLHVTLRMQRHVWNLRSRRCFRILENAFLHAANRVDARVAHFSVQGDHVHLIVEARDAQGLARAIQAMCIRMAKGLNKLMVRNGAVFGDRYHSRPLRTPTEVRRCLVYVYGNARKHLARYGHTFHRSWIDPYSSGGWFDGWTVRVRPPPGTCLVLPASTWLLTTGWKERGGGAIRPEETPALTSSA